MFLKNHEDLFLFFCLPKIFIIIVSCSSNIHACFVVFYCFACVLIFMIFWSFISILMFIYVVSLLLCKYDLTFTISFVLLKDDDDFFG